LPPFHQLGDPLRILGVRLVTVQPLDMLRIHQHQLGKLPLQQIPQRPPILAGRFHGGFPDPAVLQPGPQLFQVAREGAELPLLDAQLGSPQRRQNAYQHAVLVYIYAAAAAIVLFHRHSFRSPSEGRLESLTFLRVFGPPAGGDNHAWFQ
jgi:hypothetical protein